MDSEPITWDAYEHRPLEHEADWFWALGIITIAAAATALILNNVLFGALILCAGATMGILARQESNTVTFTLSNRGLSIGDSFYPIKDLRAFWIIETPSETEDTKYLLLVDTPRFMTPDLAIPLVGVNPETVHLWFTEHDIPEVELRESFALKILEVFGF